MVPQDSIRRENTALDVSMIENVPTEEKFVKYCLTLTPALVEKVQEMLDTTYHQDVPDFWTLPDTSEMYVPVRDGEIRVLHFNPPDKISKRPLVMVVGWGGLPSGYTDAFMGLNNQIELYYIETREKHTSRIDKRKGKFTMSQKGEDVGRAIKYLDLEKRDFILLGICWGSAVILQGLMDKTIEAPTVVTFDPMNKLWYSKVFLTLIAPLLPVFLVNWLKPLLKWLQVRKIKEEVQHKRAGDFVDKGEIWKWKRAAIQVKNFQLFGNLHKISREVIVVNGTTDTIHEKENYPKIARELPNGRFLYLETDQFQRERLFGLIGREFAMISAKNEIPSCFDEFEKHIQR